jgi:hypothetical protein
VPLGVETNVQERIEAFLHDGHKIAAIKLYRETTGVNLKDAKDAIEAYHEELIRLRPSEFGVQTEPTRPRTVSGCSGVFLVIILILAGFVALIVRIV